MLQHYSLKDSSAGILMYLGSRHFTINEQTFFVTTRMVDFDTPKDDQLFCNQHQWLTTTTSELHVTLLVCLSHDSVFFLINVDSFSQRKTKVSLDMLKLFSQPCVVNYD